jgi:hypothetical protein
MFTSTKYWRRQNNRVDTEETLVVGQVLETALLKAPLLYLRAGQLDKAVKRLAWRSNQPYWYSLYLALLFTVCETDFNSTGARLG